MVYELNETDMDFVPASSACYSTQLHTNGGRVYTNIQANKHHFGNYCA